MISVPSYIMMWISTNIPNFQAHKLECKQKREPGFHEEEI